MLLIQSNFLLPSINRSAVTKDRDHPALSRPAIIIANKVGSR
jgi:hypothetical protein